MYWGIHISFQAVDSLVRATDASVVVNAVTGPPSASSSTADDLIHKVTYPLGQRSRRKTQGKDRASERPAACSNDLDDEIFGSWI